MLGATPRFRRCFEFETVKIRNAPSSVINASINDSASHNIQDQDRAQSDVPLVRLSVTVAMTPRSMASKEALKARIEGFNSGTSFSHCPHADGTGLNYGQKKLPAEVNLPILDESQRSLL